MTIVKVRKSWIRKCVEENIISPTRKRIFRDFDVKYKMSGRSGGHGKKFNILSRELLNLSKNVTFIQNSNCADDSEERKQLIEELKTRIDQFNKKAKGINHKNFRK